MKYKVLVTRLSYGNIEICAENREVAKSMALSEDNRNKISWFKNDDYQIAEVTRLQTKCDKCGVDIPDNSIFCYKCGAKIQ